MTGSRYDALDASRELEQRICEDLSAALKGRGCVVNHNGTENRHAPGGVADIEIRDSANSRLILVEVTKRTGAKADGEFAAMVSHLDTKVNDGGYSAYGMLFVSPKTSARMSSHLRDMVNRAREEADTPGRIIPLDFDTLEMLVDQLRSQTSDKYPASNFRTLFERWEEASVNDASTKLFVARTLLPSAETLLADIEAEVSEDAHHVAASLRYDLGNMENELRDMGVTGHGANNLLIYLTFLRLYEERNQRNTGKPNRFTVAGFATFCEGVAATNKSKYGDRLFEFLLHEVAHDKDLTAAGLLRDATGAPQTLPQNVTDADVKSVFLDAFDKYDFYGREMDVLGVVFETLARRSEKDTRVGQFFTPSTVVDFCVNLVPARPTDAVLDPAVGTGRFLIRAMDRMLKSSESSDQEAKVKERGLMGVDLDDWVATIAKMNMFIHGDGKTNITVGNGLTLGDLNIFHHHESGLSQQIDVVLTNPPLGNTDFTKAAAQWKRSKPEQSQTSAADTGDFLDRLGVVSMRSREEIGNEKIEQRLDKAQQVVTNLNADIGTLKAQPQTAQTEADIKEANKRLDSKQSAITALQLESARLRAAIKAGNVSLEARGTKMKGGALFLGAIATYLKPARDTGAVAERKGGWCAIVLDDAILNAPSYANVRKFIREKYYVKAVVSLGRNTFKYLAHTDAKTSVVVLTRQPEDNKQQNEPIFFAHAEHAGHDKVGKPTENQLPGIEEMYKAVQDIIRDAYQNPHYLKTEARLQIAALPDYGSRFFVAECGTGGSRLDYFNARMIHQAGNATGSSGPTTLRKYVNVAKLQQPEKNASNEYKFATINRQLGVVQSRDVKRVQYEPKDLWVVKKDYLIVSGIDAVNGAVAVADQSVGDGNHVMSKEMYAYEVLDSNEASAVYLGMLLRAKATRESIEGITTGVTNRTRLASREALLDLAIPELPSIDVQEEIATSFLKAVANYNSSLTKREAAESQAASLWDPVGDQT